MRVLQQDLEILRGLERAAEDLRLEIAAYLHTGSEIEPGPLSIKNGRVVDASDTLQVCRSPWEKHKERLDTTELSGRWFKYYTSLWRFVIDLVRAGLALIGRCMRRTSNLLPE